MARVPRGAPRRGRLCMMGGQDCTRAEKFQGSGLGCPLRNWGAWKTFEGGIDRT